MKKSMLFLILLLLTFLAHAQKFNLKNFSVGVTAGATYSRIKSYPNDDVDKSTLPENSQKFCVEKYWGATVQYTLKPNWQIGVGINYLINKIKYSIEDTKFINPDSTIVNAYKNVEYSTYVLNVPLLAFYNFYQKKNTPFVFAGAGLNIYLGTHQKYKVLEDGSSMELLVLDDKYYNSDVTKLNIPLIVGGGYRCSISKKFDVRAQASYNFNIKNFLANTSLVQHNFKINYWLSGVSLIYNLNFLK